MSSMSLAMLLDIAASSVRGKSYDASTGTCVTIGSFLGVSAVGVRASLRRAPNTLLLQLPSAVLSLELSSCGPVS